MKNKVDLCVVCEKVEMEKILQSIEWCPNCGCIRFPDTNMVHVRTPQVMIQQMNQERLKIMDELDKAEPSDNIIFKTK